MQLTQSLTAEIFDFSTLTYQQALDQLLTLENIPLGQTRTFMILTSDFGYQLVKATAWNSDWICGTSSPAVSIGNSFMFSRHVSGGASTEISPFSHEISGRAQTLGEVAGVNTYTFTAEQDYNYALLLFNNGGATISSITTSGNGTIEEIDTNNDPHVINMKNVSNGDSVTINSGASGRNRGIILK